MLLIVLPQKNHLNNVEITERQQKELFKISYAREEAEAKRVTTKYYKTNWKSLNPKIQEILIDMKYRGDLRPTSSSAAQKALKAAVKENNLQKFKQVCKTMQNVATLEACKSTRELVKAHLYPQTNLVCACIFSINP